MKKKLFNIMFATTFLLSGCYDQGENKKSQDYDQQQHNNSEQKLSFEQTEKNKEIFNDLISETKNFSFGENASPTLIFFDPQCPHCHELFENTRNSIFKKEKFIWIPVAFLNEKSNLQAESIIESKDPQKTFLEHEILYSQNKSGMIPYSIISEDAKQDIAKNNKIFSKTKFTGVPVMIKLGKNGTLDAFPGVTTIEQIKQFLNK